MARGIRVVGEAISAYTTDPSWALGSQSFTVCGWAEVLGAATTTWGHSPFGTKVTGGNPLLYLGTDVADAHIGTSWQIDAWDSVNNHIAGPTWAVGNVRYFALVWNASTSTYSYFSALDGAGALTDHGDQITATSGTLGEIHVGWSGWGGEANNHELTNVKVWTRTLSEAELLQEMQSEAVVNTASQYAHWELRSSSDTADQTGNGHTLTMHASVTDGDMDVGDLGGQSVSPTGVASGAGLGAPSLELRSAVDLSPNGDGTIAAGWTATGGTDFWTEVDENPDSPDDATYIRGPDGSTFLLLDDMPADFQEMRAASVKLRLRGDSVSGSKSIYTRLYASDDTPLSDESAAVTRTDDTWATVSVDLDNVVAGTSTQWNGARLRLRVV